jgi:hypothetical protein
MIQGLFYFTIELFDGFEFARHKINHFNEFNL